MDHPAELSAPPSLATTMAGPIRRERLLLGLCIGGFFVFALLASVAFGVTVADAIKYSAYQLLYVGLPGIALCSILCPRDSRLFLITSGFAVGHALEIIAFLFASSLGWRKLYFLTPFLVLAPAVFVWATGKRPRPFSLAAENNRLSISAAVLLLAVYVYVVFAVSLCCFAGRPLPGSAEGASYFADLIEHIGDAAEIKHRWPIRDVRISGEPWVYHYFAMVHAAASSYVTGISIPVVILRLAVVSWFLLFVWQIYSAGLEIYQSPLVGVVAVGGTLILSEMLEPLGEPLVNLTIDLPTTFGLILFVPAVVHIHHLLEKGVSAGRFVVVALLSVAAAGAKAIILPVIVAALGGYIAVRWLREKSLDRRSMAVFAVVVPIFIASVLYYLQDGSPEKHTQWFEPFFTIKQGSVVYRRIYPSLVNTIQSFADDGVLASFFEYAAAIGIIGIDLILRYAVVLPALFVFGWWTFKGGDTRGLWPLMLFLASALFGYLVANSWHGQVKFLHYGHVALMIPASYGFWILYHHRHQNRLFEAGWILTLVIALSFTWDPVGRRNLRVVADHMVPGTGNGGWLTKGLYEALSFLRDRSPVDAVVAVNGPFLNDGQTSLADYYYSAFSERRIFLEGWFHSADYQAHVTRNVREHAAQLGRRRARSEAMLTAPNPYSGRVAVLLRLFEENDPASFSRLAAQHKIDYLLVDKVHGRSVVPPARAVKKLFGNPHAEIYQILKN